MGELENYRHTAFVVLDNFNDKEVIESDISKYAYFVTGSGENALVKGNIYLAYPDDEQMLLEMSIPESTIGLARTLKLKMNKKLDQQYKSSINFNIK